MKWNIIEGGDDNDENDMDEKKIEWSDTEWTPFNTKQSKYEYKLDGLNKNRKYRLKLLFCEENGNGNGDRNIIDFINSTFFSFKTKDGFDIEDEKFVYKHDYDSNGICYYLGTNYGKNKSWTNPAKSKKIKIKSSGWYQSGGSIYDMVARTAKMSRTRYDIPTPWVTIDFGDNILIKPTHYTLRHYTRDWCYIKNWTVLGSLDGINWEIIKKHSTNWWNDSSPFTKPGQSITFSIASNKYYRIFKIQMTSKNNYPDWSMCVNGFEVYGYVRGNKN